MALSRNEAVEMLGEISRTEQRSAELREYAFASPGFIVWGLIWAVGYSGSYLLPNYGFRGGINWLWFALTLIGVAASFAIGRHQHRHQHPDAQAMGRAIGFRFGMTFFALFLFVAATFAVLRLANPLASAVFIPLLVALAYAIFGIWRGQRFLLAGIAVALLTLGGWFMLREFFLLWMAVVGGGALVLTGLWLRKV